MRLLAAENARCSPSTTVPHADAPGDVGLRVEEDLRVPHALRGGPCEVGVGEVGEVLLGPQDGHELVVQVRDRLEVVEEIRLAQLLGVRVGERDAVAGGEFEGQLGSRVPSMWRCSSAWGGASDVRTGVYRRSRAMTPRRLVRRRLIAASAPAPAPDRAPRSAPLEPGHPACPLEFSPDSAREVPPGSEYRWLKCVSTMPYARVPRHPSPPGRPSVAVVDGELVIAVQERRLDDEEVAALGEGVHALTQPRVHDEREPLCPRRTSLTSSSETPPSAPSRWIRPTSGPLIPCSARCGQHPPTVRLDQPVAEGLHGVGEPAGLQGVEGVVASTPSASTGASVSSTVSR